MIVNPGIRRFLGSAIQRLFNSASFYAPLTHSLVLERGTGSPTYTRATTATFDDWEGVLRTAIAGEARFEGARRVRNLVTTASEDFSSADWLKVNTTVVANQAVSPNGATTADLVYPTTTGTLRYFWRTITGTSVVGSTKLVQSIYAKAAGMSWIYLGLPGTGANQGAWFNVSTGVVGTIKTGALNPTIEDVGDGWYRCSLGQVDAIDTSGYPIYSVADADNSTTATTNGTDGIYFWGAQLEDVTAQTTQTAGEYVSVGALDYRSELNRLYLSLPGTAGHYASTPDSVAVSTIVDIDLRAKLNCSDWTPAALVNIAGTDPLTGAPNRTWYFILDTAGKLLLGASIDGSTANIATSSVAVGATDGTDKWVRVTRTDSTGVQKFYTSNDGVNWTQLGTDITTTAGAIFDSASKPLYLGNIAAGSTGLNGRIHSFQLYSAGVLAADFNPHRDATTPTGTITSSTTGEVWTINGASSVVRSDYYHGSFVDGIKCYDTDRSGNPITTTTTYDAVSLNGVAGTYVSTPDSVAASITGDIELQTRELIADVSPAVAQTLIAKWTSAPNVAYLFRLGTDGKMYLYTSADGTTVRTHASSVTAAVAGLVDGTAYWFKVTRSASTGVVKFYFAADTTGTPSYTQWGADVAGTVEGIADTNAIVTLGFDNGTALLSGKIYQAQIYNGINGTLAVDFDASRYAGGTTLTGSTGETWTLNGNAVIHPTNYPLVGYVPWEARTNFCLQSNAFTTTWTETGTVAATQNLVGPDGGTTGWTLTDNDAGTPEGILQTYGALTAANYAQSVFIKKTSGATSFPVIRLNEPVTPKEALCTVDTNNGVATVWTAYTGSTIVASSASCVSHNADWWRVTLVFAATTASWRIIFYPSATTNATQSTGTVSATVTGTCGIYGSQLELGSSATPYIPTTTVAVARNADVDQYPTTAGPIAAAGTVYLDFTPYHAPSGTIALWGTYVDASNYTAILHDATNLIFRKRIAGSNYDATIANAFVSGTTYKVAATWGAAGAAIYLDGVAGTPHANTTAAQIAATMQVGADGNSLQQPGAGTTNLRIWQRQLSSPEGVAVTA